MNVIAEANVIWSGTTPDGRGIAVTAFTDGTAPIRYVLAAADGSLRHCGSIDEVALAVVGGASDQPRPSADRLALAATYAGQIHRAANLRLTSGRITDRGVQRFERAICEAAGAATLSLFREAGFVIVRSAGRTTFATVPEGLEGYREFPLGCRAAIDEDMLLERAQQDTVFDW